MKLWVASLREEVVLELRASQSVWAICPRLLAPWTAVLNDEYACGLYTLTGLRLVELENAKANGELALACCTLS